MPVPLAARGEVAQSGRLALPRSPGVFVGWRRTVSWVLHALRVTLSCKSMAPVNKRVLGEGRNPQASGRRPLDEGLGRLDAAEVSTLEPLKELGDVGRGADGQLGVGLDTSQEVVDDMFLLVELAAHRVLPGSSRYRLFLRHYF